VITLVIGGTRSGKSEVAERLACRAGQPVTVLVPATPTDDPDLLARIAVHRARRPPGWPTIECGAALVDALRACHDTALVDSLGTWVAETADFAVDTGAMTRALQARAGATFLVSEEVGLSVHAPTESGRRFADTLGELNTAVAGVAHEVLLVFAGRVIALESFGPAFSARSPVHMTGERAEEPKRDDA
jgi:adenosyl cobinamide kinase/adenosyl cobinamide phosphate guanylyltransferase